MVTLLAFALGTAQAQTAADWSTYGTVLLTGSNVPYGSTIGSPSVVYDSVNDRYIMVFETFIGSTANCPAGEWGLGTAFSTDGLSWSVRPTPLIDPNPASGTPNYYSCVAAHPGAIYLPPGAGGAAGGTIYVYFKAEQASDACTVLGGTPSWGCEQYTGVGSVRVRLRANGSIRDTLVAPAPLLAKSTNFGYPKPIRYQNTLAISYTEYPNVMIATASSPTGPFLDQGTALDVNDYTVDWMQDEFFNAAIACRDTGSFPLELFAGGRDTDFAAVLDGGIGKAVASPLNITNWTLATVPQFSWVGDDAYRHWDVLRVDASDYLLYYDEKDGSGNNQIRLATTLPSFSWANTSVYDKACP
jgi:hypothetical protein